MSRINTNVSSLFAQKTLSRTNDQLNTAMSRLSSGLRINTAADDPAGLIASEVLRADMTGVSQAITNTDRADQLIQTADSALGQVSNLLNDIRGLVVEAANDGALSTEQIAANQLQVDSSLEAIDRIARTTTFGGKKLLDGTLGVLTTTTDADFADIDVQQVNMGSSGTSTASLHADMTVNVTTTKAATQGSLTDGSTAVGTFKAGNAGSELTFTLTAATTAVGQVIDNMKIRFVENGTNAASANYDNANNVLEIRLDDNAAANGNNLNTTIQSAISGLTEFSAATVSAGNIITTTDRMDALHLNGVAVGGAVNDSGDVGQNLINRVQDRVVKITGNKGSETFTFATGTTQAEMATAINAVADATGVSATTTGSNLGNLVLSAVDYGSAGFVDVEVISEGSTGNYKNSGAASVGRKAGEDIEGTVNGIKGSGNGNTLTIKSGVLSGSFRMVNNVTNATHTFTITGGGANFQLGADVITPQQARIGIESVNTGSLGGLSGTLYQLRTGQDSALATDSITAGKIVDEAILSVANTRGRLGAFSATTLESNKIALSDYLVNLTEAESALRDADFAKESAALTRAQVLVQSGTSILAIANQNPQNMLALIR